MSFHTMRVLLQSILMSVLVTEKVWEEHSTDASETEEPAKPPPVKQAKTEESVKSKVGGPLPIVSWYC